MSTLVLVRATLVSFFLVTTILISTTAHAQYAQPVASPTVGGRQVTINTTPPGMRARSSHAMYQIAMTPHTFSVPANAAAAITIDGPGMERLTVPVPAENANLHINVQMSRPVFEWGLVFAIIGGATLLTGFGLWMAAIADYNGRSLEAGETLEWDGLDLCYESEDDSWSSSCTQVTTATFGTMFLSIGGGIAIPGILMAILDRRHNPSYSYSR